MEGYSPELIIIIIAYCIGMPILGWYGIPAWDGITKLIQRVNKI